MSTLCISFSVCQCFTFNFFFLLFFCIWKTTVCCYYSCHFLMYINKNFELDDYRWRMVVVRIFYCFYLIIWINVWEPRNSCLMNICCVLYHKTLHGTFQVFENISNVKASYKTLEIDKTSQQQLFQTNVPLWSTKTTQMSINSFNRETNGTGESMKWKW